MSEKRESGLHKLLFGGGGHTEPEEKVLAYVAHRLKAGAPLDEVLREEYVVHNTNHGERDELLRDSRLNRKAREGLKQYFESDELKPEAPPHH